MIKTPDNDQRRGNELRTRASKKTRVTLYLDPVILESYRARAADSESGYQTLINEALRHTIHPDAAPLTVASLRRVLRAELDKRSTDPRTLDPI
jgi:hypothetical protein